MSTLKVTSHPTARTTTVAPQPPTPATSITSRLPTIPATAPSTSLLSPLTRSTQPAPPEGNTDPPPPPAKVPQPPSGKRPGVQGAGAGGRVGIGIGHTVLEATGDSLTIDMVNTSSLMAVLMFGLFFFVVTVIVFLRQAYESFRRKDYTQVDYLINGMYSDSGM
uniref:Uncharacterized protein n=1 Tax=Electrophorus electricus TaxID=8005 RepID=A0A4W4GR34_ELEEL